MLETFIIPAIGLGLSAAALPGPLQAYLANITLLYGWRRAALILLAPIITDTPIVIIVVFILGQLPDGLIPIIRLAGGILLLWIAWGAWNDWKRGVGIGGGASTASDGRARAILGTAILMNLLSPGPYLFWTTVNGPLLREALAISPLHGAAFVLSFYGVFLGGWLLLSILLDRLGQLNARLTRLFLLGMIILLVWFGTALIAETFGLGAWHRIIGLALLVAGIGWWGKRALDARSVSAPKP